MSDSPGGMFGSRPDPEVSARKRGFVLVLGAVLVAAAAALGYVVVARWNTEQPPASTPFTETTVAPPAATQSSPPAATPSETSPSTPSTPQSEPKPEPSAASPAQAPPAKAKPPTSSVAAPPLSPPKSGATPAGRMLIRSTPAGAQVAVNGVARGVTPLVLRNLPLGSYTIRVTMPGFATSDHQVVLAPDRDAQSLEVALQEGAGPATPETRGAPPSSQAQFGALVVESRPAGASVYFNDKLVGQTPLSVADLPVGSGTVRLELAGYRSWSSKVQVSAGTRARVAASLETVTPQ
jgi:hypothetical protein